jgi:hypothetical protein
MRLSIYSPMGTLCAKFLDPEHAAIFLAALQRGTIETWTVKCFGRIVYTTDHTQQSSFDATSIARTISGNVVANFLERARKGEQRAAVAP